MSNLVSAWARPARVLWAAFVVVLIAGGLTIVGANGVYNIPGKWFGFVTDTKDLAKATNVTADQIHQSVQNGAQYALINGLFFQSHMTLVPADKIAPYAGQTVFVDGMITTNSLLKGAHYIPNSDSGGGFFEIKVNSVEPKKVGSEAYYIDCIFNLTYNYCKNAPK